MNMNLKIATVAAVLAAGLVAAPLVNAHEGAPPTQGEPGPMMGGGMTDHQAEGGMMGEMGAMQDMMKTCSGVMRGHEDRKARGPHAAHAD